MTRLRHVRVTARRGGGTLHDVDTTVELLTRRDCGLCESAHRLLEPLARELGMRVVLVDVDGDPALRAAYDVRVPVVRMAGRDLCEGRITASALRGALTAVTP